FGLVAASATLPRSKVRGSTSATFGGDATSGSGLTVTSQSDNNATTTISVISFGAISGALNSARAKITEEAGTSASVTGMVTIGGSAVTVTATSGDDVIATINGVSGGLLDVGISLPMAEAFGETTASIGQGASVNAGQVDVTAQGTTNATATTNAISVSAIGGGFLEADANAGGIVDAFIGRRAPSLSCACTATPSTAQTGVHVGSGAINVKADATITATATAGGVTVALLSISDFNPRAHASGLTRAYVRDNVDIDAGSMLVQAGESGDKATYAATSTANVVKVGVGGGGGIVPYAEVTGGGEAFLGAPNGTTGVNTIATRIEVGGTITVQTYTDLHATASTESTSASLVEADVQNSTPDAGGATRAYV